MGSRSDISVVTPSLNQGAFLEQCIRSVLGQEDAAVEYIVVDGGSTDRSRAILEAYEGRIDHLVIEPDDGQADALVKGFARASGEFVCYLNSDDYLLPGALATACRYLLEHPATDAVYSHRTYVDERDRLLRYWALPRHFDFINLRWDFIPQETCVWRRSAMDRVGGIDAGFQFAMDYDLFARMMLAGSRFERLDGFHAVFREHPAAKTSRLMQSTGLAEVSEIQRRLGISVSHWHHYPCGLFVTTLRSRSKRMQKRYPDGPPGFEHRAR